MIAVATPRVPEHLKLKEAYGRYLGFAALLAMTVHFSAALLSPPYLPRPYQLREKPLEVIVIPDVLVIPPPPKPIVRPELPVEPVVSDVADPFETIPAAPDNPFLSPLPVEETLAPKVFVAIDSEPRVVHQAAPVYPELARQAEAEGEVRVMVLIDETGRVAAAEVVWSNTIESLERAAVAAAYQWLFTPAKQRDIPVRAQIVIPFAFRLH